MIASDSLVKLENCPEGRMASMVLKGERIFNPITEKYCTVSFIVNRIVNGSIEKGTCSCLNAPVRIEAGSISGRFPVTTVRVSQTTKILHAEKISGSSISRVVSSKALDLVGQPGIFIDEVEGEISYTKIILAESGLLYISGLLIEAPALSIVPSNLVNISESTVPMRNHQQTVHAVV